MIIKPILGMDRVRAPHELLMTQDGECKCSLLRNMVARDRCIRKIGGTKRFKSADGSTIPDDLSAAVPWVHKSYHKRADGSFRKVPFAFCNGEIYLMDLVAGTLTSKQTGFNVSAIPVHATMQVSGNSVLYFFSGEYPDEVYKYDGNGSYAWEKTTINENLGRTVESGEVHLDRMWYVSKNSSIIGYSTTLYPEDFSTDADDIVVGQEADSVIRRAMVGADEVLYVFKSNSIWRLYGRTKSEFQFRKITGKYGLAAKRGVCRVGSGFVFLNEYTKELCFFGGTEASITPLTEDTIRLREIIDIGQIHKVDMCVYDGLFRFSFKHISDSPYPDRELIYPVNEPGPDGLPKWNETYGIKIYCYSPWVEQGDRELVTGRSDIGRIMFHNREFAFDEVAADTRVRTREIVASEDNVVRFRDFFIKAKPSSKTDNVNFKYYLNGRRTPGAEENKLLYGETRSVAGISILTQDLVNDRIVPLHDYSLGNSISFEISQESRETDLEIYSIAFKAQKRYKIRNQLVGL